MSRRVSADELSQGRASASQPARTSSANVITPVAGAGIARARHGQKSDPAKNLQCDSSLQLAQQRN